MIHPSHQSLDEHVSFPKTVQVSYVQVRFKIVWLLSETTEHFQCLFTNGYVQVVCVWQSYISDKSKQLSTTLISSFLGIAQSLDVYDLQAYRAIPSKHIVSVHLTISVYTVLASRHLSADLANAPYSLCTPWNTKTFSEKIKGMRFFNCQVGLSVLDSQS